jgi:hypothetical protein
MECAESLLAADPDRSLPGKMPDLTKRFSHHGSTFNSARVTWTDCQPLGTASGIVKHGGSARLHRIDSIQSQMARRGELPSSLHLAFQANVVAALIRNRGEQEKTWRN